MLTCVCVKRPPIAQRQTINKTKELLVLQSRSVISACQESVCVCQVRLVHLLHISYISVYCTGLCNGGNTVLGLTRGFNFVLAACECVLPPIPRTAVVMAPSICCLELSRADWGWGWFDLSKHECVLYSEEAVLILV